MADADAWLQTSQGVEWWAQREPLPLLWRNMVGFLEKALWQGAEGGMGGNGTRHKAPWCGDKEHYSLLFTMLEQGTTDTITKAGIQSQLRVNPPN